MVDPRERASRLPPLTHAGSVSASGAPGRLLPGCRESGARMTPCPPAMQAWRPPKCTLIAADSVRVDGESPPRLGCGNLPVPLQLQPSCMPDAGDYPVSNACIAGEFPWVSEVRRLRGDLLRLAGRRPGGCLCGACT